ncbi:MAG: nitroreductase [Chloroflexota bacterium]|nr:MAG: nitroreductase [Chloroflexota bacterium]
MPLVKLSSPRGLVRLLLRLPIWLYRARLGWLLGHRFLLLTHVGRKTGLLHRTVLEVVHFDKATDVYMVASGWGEKSDWLRNIEKTPTVFVNVGGRRFEAMARRLSVAEAQQALLDYARHHPATFRTLAWLMTSQRLQAAEEDCFLLAQSVPLVALQPRKISA